MIEWIVTQVDRSRGLRTDAGAVHSPVGLLPAPGALRTDGLEVSDDDLAALFDVPAAPWQAEAELTAEFFETFAGKVPQPLWAQLTRLRERLDDAS